MTDRTEAERLAEYDKEQCLLSIKTGQVKCWGPFLRRLLGDRDATIATLRSERDGLRMSLDTEIQRLTRELDAATREAGVGEWRAIEMAPKDGRPILSWDGNTMAVVIYCGCKRKWFLVEDRDYTANPESPIDWEGLTHWMPLPDPPVEAKDAERLAGPVLLLPEDETISPQSADAAISTEPGATIQLLQRSIASQSNLIKRLTEERDAATREAETLRGKLLEPQNRALIAEREAETLRAQLADIVAESTQRLSAYSAAVQQAVAARSEAQTLREEVGRLAAALVKLQGEYCITTAPPNPMEAPAQPTTDDVGQSNETALDSLLRNSGDSVAVPDRDRRPGSGKVGTLTTDDVERAREVVEAFPSDAFDRIHTERLVPEVAAALTAARAQGEARSALFVDGEFTAHSGDTLPFKIDCDALTDADISTLAAEIARRFKFSCVVGVPRGGIRLQDALAKYLLPGYGTLIVDDVLTTGRSMEEYRQRFDNSTSPKPIQGAAIFARGPRPDWITPLFGDFAQGEAKGRAEMREMAARVADEHGKLFVIEAPLAAVIAAAIRFLPTPTGKGEDTK